MTKQEIIELYRPYLGIWTITTMSQGIASFELAVVGDNIVMSCLGTDGGLVPGDWGTVVIDTYTDTPSGKKEVAFLASFDTERFNAVLSVYANNDLMVIAANVAMKGEGTPPTYFIREFYAHTN